MIVKKESCMLQSSYRAFKLCLLHPNARSSAVPEQNRWICFQSELFILGSFQPNPDDPHKVPHKHTRSRTAATAKHRLVYIHTQAKSAFPAPKWHTPPKCVCVCLSVWDVKLPGFNVPFSIPQLSSTHGFFFNQHCQLHSAACARCTQQRERTQRGAGFSVRKHRGRAAGRKY